MIYESLRIIKFNRKYINRGIALFLIPIFISGCISQPVNPEPESTRVIESTKLVEKSSTPLPQITTLPTPTVCPVVLEMAAMPLETSEGSGKEYFFDSVGGSDKNSGSEPDQAMQSLEALNSLNFKPGDVIHLKRGSIWTGTLMAWASGSDGNPITFTSYGESGDLPTFRNPGDMNNLTNAIRINGDWVVISNVKVQEAQFAGVYISDNADHNIVMNIEATQVGEGVNVHGRFNKILGNYIHDLNMVKNTEGGNDDYGAVGVWLFNSDNEVAYNRLVNLRAPSFDYIEDGGAVEFFKDVSNSHIHHNYVFNAKGFIEIGGGSAIDNVISYNLVINSGRTIGVHLAGKFGSDLRNLKFENNTVIDTSEAGYPAAINFWFGTPTTDMLTLRNNIFYLKNYEKLVHTAEGGADFIHENNIYYLQYGELGITPGLGEVVGDPAFVNLICGDFRLSAESPAIDNGLPQDYQYDFSGHSVPSGNSIDIGAFEYEGI